MHRLIARIRIIGLCCVCLLLKLPLQESGEYRRGIGFAPHEKGMRGGSERQRQVLGGGVDVSNVLFELTQFVKYLLGKTDAVATCCQLVYEGG